MVWTLLAAGRPIAEMHLYFRLTRAGRVYPSPPVF